MLERFRNKIAVINESEETASFYSVLIPILSEVNSKNF